MPDSKQREDNMISVRESIKNATSDSVIEQAKVEIARSLALSTFCMRRIGLSFEEPESTAAYLKQKLMFVFSVFSICYHVLSDVVYIVVALSDSPRVEDIVPFFHIFGYGILSIAKVFVLWYKKDVFSQLLQELAEIWPMAPLNEEYESIKNKSLDALQIAHKWYFMVNVYGVWFYNLTPIAAYFYKLWQGEDATMGFVWITWYPIDKYQPVVHVFVYIFEMFIGVTCVWIMVSTDLLFSGMASHIGLLLRLLHHRLKSIGTTPQTDDENYLEIVENIKLHQRLIRYCNDLENAFSLSNFVNVALSSINICCVVFVIFLLEPLPVLNSKLFLVSALIQIGILCWYADDIYYASADVAAAALKSYWYLIDPRCRRALLFLINRAQKPIAFTAMNFTDINLVTYSAIISRAYSYFALLYTMYNKK